MSSLSPNYPKPVHANCGCKSNCGCGEPQKNPYGNIFSDRALYVLNKNDPLCDTYDKINANMEMLANGYLLLAEALTQKTLVQFGPATPIGCQGALFFNTTTQKLLVWNEGMQKYVDSYGCNSLVVDNVPGEPYCPDNKIPTLQNLRNIGDGVDTNHFTNTFGEMALTFVNSTPTCSVGLFIFDKSDQVLKVWAEDDMKYVPAYSCLSVMKTNVTAPSHTGTVYETIKREK